MFECRLNEFLVEILQEYNAALGLNNPPPTAQLLNAMASFVKQNTIKKLSLMFDEDAGILTAKSEFNDDRYVESVVDISSLKYTLDVYDLAEKLQGTDTVVVDINETNDKVEIHLDSEIVSKIERALLMPLNAPREVEFVAIDSTGQQVSVEPLYPVVYDSETHSLGVDTNELGTKLYKHRFDAVDITIISTLSRKMTPYEIKELFTARPVSGCEVINMINSSGCPILFITINDNDTISWYWCEDGGNITDDSTSLEPNFIEDYTVTKL